MRFTVSFVTLLVISGAALAHGPRESDVVGQWKEAAGSVLTCKADKSFIWMQSNMPIAGTWRLDHGDFVLMPATFNHQPVSAIKKKLLSQPKVSAAIRAFANDVDKPNFLKLSKNGNLLTTDKTRDRNAGPPAIFLRMKISNLSSA